MNDEYIELIITQFSIHMQKNDVWSYRKKIGKEPKLLTFQEHKALKDEFIKMLTNKGE